MCVIGRRKKVVFIYMPVSACKHHLADYIVMMVCALVAFCLRALRRFFSCRLQFRNSPARMRRRRRRQGCLSTRERVLQNYWRNLVRAANNNMAGDAKQADCRALPFWPTASLECRRRNKLYIRFGATGNEISTGAELALMNWPRMALILP